jgi:hypothetical protein
LSFGKLLCNCRVCNHHDSLFEYQVLGFDGKNIS